MERIWMPFRDYVNTKEALLILCEQTYYKSNIPGPFAIQSQKSKRILTKYSEDEQLTVDEIINPWIILIVDTEAEKKTTEIRALLKNVSCSGYSWAKIDHMSIDDIWQYVVETVNDDEIKKYKLLKYYFEENIYRKKNK